MAEIVQTTMDGRRKQQKQQQQQQFGNTNSQVVSVDSEDEAAARIVQIFVEVRKVGMIDTLNENFMGIMQITNDRSVRRRFKDISVFSTVYKYRNLLLRVAATVSKFTYSCIFPLHSLNA